MKTIFWCSPVPNLEKTWYFFGYLVFISNFIFDIGINITGTNWARDTFNSHRPLGYCHIYRNVKKVFANGIVLPYVSLARRFAKFFFTFLNIWKLKCIYMIKMGWHANSVRFCYVSFTTRLQYWGFSMLAWASWVVI